MGDAKPPEIRQLMKDIFREWDANGDGIISPDELKHVLKTLGAVTDSELEQLFVVIDSNHNGSIEYNEFIDWLTTPGSKCQLVKGQVEIFNLEEALKPLFDVYDSKRTGKIDKDEFREAYGIVTGALELKSQQEDTKNSGRRTFHEADEVFVAADTGRTGYISFSEFVEWQRQNIKESELSGPQLTEHFKKLAEVVQSVFQMSEEHQKHKHLDQDKLMERLNQIASEANKLFKNSTRLGVVEKEVDRSKFTNTWEKPPDIRMERLLQYHMSQVPVPTKDVRDMKAVVVNVLPEELWKRKESDPGAPRRWIARVDRLVQYNSGRKAHSPHYYAWAGLRWTDASPDDFMSSRATLAPEFRLLALIYTEAKFGQVLRWDSILAALDGAEELGILNQETRHEFEGSMFNMVHGMLAAQTGRSPTDDEVERSLFETVQLSPLLTMSMLCDMGVVPPNEVWADPDEHD
eukprot:gnl/TRDRNA2_/TRDRNA2_44534_c0_seq1.p1 gnl/TRDRNA2_/TRDRNA2_44534_c0~~gnl/TRDRNA2_/TRDRNA2_44534_c0_seq1.p1  ORF type:complete len:462 (+),score=99.94 gnl/TRDRNA2_/TRDRNA2_44534_c0_seq1:101-1486(+)